MGDRPGDDEEPPTDEPGEEVPPASDAEPQDSAADPAAGDEEDGDTAVADVPYDISDPVAVEANTRDGDDDANGDADDGDASDDTAPATAEDNDGGGEAAADPSEPDQAVAAGDDDTTPAADDAPQTNVPSGESAFGDSAAAPDDQEMPLTAHVEEMALRVMAVGLVVIGVGGIALFYADDLINFLWYSFLGPGIDVCPGPRCPESVRPRVYHPLALVLAKLKVASLIGIIAALPVGVYQTYRFMRPGLYPRERRYYLAAVPTSLVLAAVGVSFAHFAVLPAMFSYFTRYSERAAEIAFGLTETFNLIVLMLGFFAITFQIPLLVMLAIMMGVTTRQWLADRRLYFWGGFAAIAFVFSPDPTGMAPLLVAVTMIALFDGTLLLLKWTSSESLVPTADSAAARRPYGWATALFAGYLVSGLPIPTGYYGQLPTVVVETLVANGLVSMTPVLIAIGLILGYELGGYLLRRYGQGEYALRARLAFHRLRIPGWLAAVVVGYLGSPNPLLLRVADSVAFTTASTLFVVGGLLVGYELLIAGLRLRERTDLAAS
jgi:sec-independent protein translocase protein TatC